MSKSPSVHIHLHIGDANVAEIDDRLTELEAAVAEERTQVGDKLAELDAVVQALQGQVVTPEVIARVQNITNSVRGIYEPPAPPEPA